MRVGPAILGAERRRCFDSEQARLLAGKAEVRETHKHSTLSRRLAA